MIKLILLSLYEFIMQVFEGSENDGQVAVSFTDASTDVHSTKK